MGKKEKHMSFKFFKVVTAGLILVVSGMCNNAIAGIITNTDHDSFIDQTTNLEWMDFGINNHLSYNQVVELLATDYYGWMLPTESQVVTLSNNLFGGRGDRPSVPYRPGDYPTHFDGSGEFRNIIDTIGFDGGNSPPSDNFGCGALFLSYDPCVRAEGMFIDDQGYLAQLKYYDPNVYIDTQSVNYICPAPGEPIDKGSYVLTYSEFFYTAASYDTCNKLFPRASIYKYVIRRPNKTPEEIEEKLKLGSINRQANTTSEFTTLLYRQIASPTISVDEPSPLAIFLLGMIGLASCRFKKYS